MRPSNVRPLVSLFVALLGALLLGACGLAESIAEDFVDDQDYELYVDGGRSGTIVRTVDGADVDVQVGVLSAGDTADDDQALAVLTFTYDRGLQPDKTRLEWILLRFQVAGVDGDVQPLGSLVVSHLPNAADTLATGTIPDPPGTDLATIAGGTAAGWRDVDVTRVFLEDWFANEGVSAFVIRFATATDGGGDADTITLAPQVEGTVQRAHLVLHFGVDL